ncbi:hypothetical protein I6I06_08690 [Paraburkholderia ginsengisoli]|uniref:Uncharacterized protein n=1 Tax=Paraburkholderia ginsengisoli TaxID=311231 RepID=A0A7T4T7B4_9BURK|nr:hypothetical protein I6I06_08690 [Paraburkholderia ginsengisoli]
MHAPYAAQYWVIGGSGAGSGGSFTLDAAFACADEPAAADDAPRSAVAADAPVAAEAAAAGALAALVVGALAGRGADAPAAAVATGSLAPGAVAAAGMLALIGAAEKVLDGSGGRDGTPVDVALLAG